MNAVLVHFWNAFSVYYKMTKEGTQIKSLFISVGQSAAVATPDCHLDNTLALTWHIGMLLSIEYQL